MRLHLRTWGQEPQTLRSFAETEVVESGIIAGEAAVVLFILGSVLFTAGALVDYLVLRRAEELRRLGRRASSGPNEQSGLICSHQ